MKITILDRESIGFDTPLDNLRALGELTVYDKTDCVDVIPRIKNTEVLIINKVKITREIISSANSLRLICVFATGYDSIDVEAAREYGVAVCNVPGYSTSSVTVFTVATVLALLTHLGEYRNFVASGLYTETGLSNKLTPVYNDLFGKTWGIVGCGAIGSAVAAVATAFGARVITYQRHPHPIYETVSLEELCKESDVITLHCPLNEESRGIIGERELRMMKPSVILVNAARGAVVNEVAVKDAVLNGNIGAFGCDVYSVEPFGVEHPYYEIKGLDNVLLTPHAAWASFEARVTCIDVIVNNIKDYFDGKITNRVDIARQK